MEQCICCLNVTLLGEDSEDNGRGMLKDYQEMTEQERDARFVEIINEAIDEEQLYELVGCEEKGIIYTDAQRIRNLLSYIQNMELSVEQKVMLQDSYLNRDKYILEITKLIDKAIAILKGHEGEILSITKVWEDYWSESNVVRKVQALAESVHGKTGEDELWIAPGIMHGAWLQIGVKTESASFKRGTPILWRLGVNMAEEFLSQSGSGVEEEHQQEEYQRILKLLGDKSKFDILLYVKEKQAYGTEIAQHFGLTTATVSHHMNQLLSNRLVDVEIQEKRVYYKTRKEELQKIFEGCKNMFQ